jgi:excisionase family DNA binding protein
MKKQTQRFQRSRRSICTYEIPQGFERLLTIDQIADLGGPCRAKLYADIKAGRLKAIKFGRSTRISESAYRAYVESAPTL